MVLTGARRLRAARKAGLKTVPAFIDPADLSKQDVLTLQIIENVQREDLTPLEKAKAIDLLMREAKCNATQVASTLGLTSGTVSKLLSILSLPEEIQAQIDAGELPVTAAYQLSKLDSGKAQVELAGKIASGELTRDGVSRAVKASKTRRRLPRKPRPVRVIAKLKDRESVSVAADALDLNSFISILERLLSQAQKALHEGQTLDALLKRLAVGGDSVQTVQ